MSLPEEHTRKLRLLLEHGPQLAAMGSAALLAISVLFEYGYFLYIGLPLFHLLDISDHLSAFITNLPMSALALIWFTFLYAMVSSVNIRKLLNSIKLIRFLIFLFYWVLTIALAVILYTLLPSVYAPFTYAIMSLAIAIYVTIFIPVMILNANSSYGLALIVVVPFVAFSNLVISLGVSVAQSDIFHPNLIYIMNVGDRKDYVSVLRFTSEFVIIKNMKPDGGVEAIPISTISSIEQFNFQ